MANAAAGSGLLAIIGIDGNVSVVDSAGKNPIVLTRDGQSGTRLYQWPTWSTDGRLAFFGASIDQKDRFALRAFIVDKVTAGATAKAAFTSEDDTFTYAYWAPGNCGKGNCRDLALLYTPATGDGLGLRMIRDDGGQFSDRQIGTGSPYYFSFSPDGQQMVWFRDSTHIDLYDVAGDKVSQTLADTPGTFSAPMWSPVDDRLLVGTVASSGTPAAPGGTTADTTDIVVAKGADRKTLLSAQSNPVSFAWSPDARMVAVVGNYNNLTVVDSASGKVLASAPEANIVAHFWSPTSDRVAYIVLGRQPPPQPSQQSGSQTRTDPANRPNLRSNGHFHLNANVSQFQPSPQAQAVLRWYVLDVKTGKSSQLVNFNPTREMVYFLTFFDQFARSHSLWSPDGRYLVYGATDNRGRPEIMRLDMQSPATPVKIADGTIGIWSWR